MPTSPSPSAGSVLPPPAAPTLPRIAVLVVHGVGNPPRDQSARSIADLLLRFHPRHYQPFRTSRLQLAVTRAPIAGDRPAETKANTKTSHRPAFDRRTDSIRALHGAKAGTTTPDEIGFGLMRDRLKQHVLSGDDQVYDTIRCDGVQLDDQQRPRCETHIHEMHWADLSSLGTSVTRAFFQLYDLFFDLCLVGRQTLDAVLALHPRSFPWRVFRCAHWLSEFLLVQPIFLINILMAAFALLLALPLAPTSVIEPMVYCGPAVLALGVFARISYALHQRIWPGVWPWLIALGAGVTGYVGWVTWQFTRHLPADQLTVVASGLAALVLVVTFGFFVWDYAKRHPGAFVVGVLFGSLALFLFGRELQSPLVAQNGGMQVVDAVLRTIEMMLVPLNVIWWFQWLLLSAILLFGWIAPSTVPVEAGEKKKLRRATFTAQLSLMLPISATLITTHCLWGAFILTLESPLANKFCDGIHRVVGTNAHLPLGDGLKALVLAGVPVLPRAVAFLGAAALVAAWALAPAIWNEVWFPKKAPKLPDDGTTWLGRNLTMAFRGMRAGGEVLRWCMIVSTIWTWWWLTVKSGSFPTELESRFIYPALLVGGAGVLAILGARGPFQFLVLGFYSVLQVAIDTINWMRAHPLDNNPQARICARYASVLRHLFTWRSPVDGRPYDSVIVVAHSQGAVITADVLRYLHHVQPVTAEQHDSVFESRPLHLFTMGCPLRQHYGQRFPHTYGWARGEDRPAPTPDPRSLWAVESWRNAFRSGDYVGRCLWHDEKDAATWALKPSEPTLDQPTEFCVGAGAHTHYWDDSAEPIAAVLHEMIEANSTGRPIPRSQAAGG